jgi:DnaJ-class molecular chaperone
VAMASDQDPRSKPCPWCKGSRRCATCEGTGKRVAKTRILHRAHAAECRACEGTGVCQLCKRLDKPP